MNKVDRRDCREISEGNRIIREAFGPSGVEKEDSVRMGFMSVSDALGCGVYYAGGCESYLVENAKDAYIRYGENRESLCEREILEKGDVLVTGGNEIYSFEFDKDGFADLIFFIPQEETSAV